MTIQILSTVPGEPMREIEISAAMEHHFSIPINHAHTILNQINSGMYARWFEGKRDLTCVDFGANVGLVSLYMFPACKEIVCVEPTPSHFNLCYELISNNFQGGIMEVNPSALSDDFGTVLFATGHSTENKITSQDGYGNNKITVRSAPLVYFFKRIRQVIDFCKIDIEGGEMKALTEPILIECFGNKRCRTFFVEVHPAFGGSQEQNCNELTKRFENAGYSVERINFETIVATQEI